MGTYTEKPDGLGSQSDDRVDVEQVDRVFVPPTTLQSFAHLDEKAILRKVCRCLPQGWFTNLFLTNTDGRQMDMRLIPMLALLYLLSFLDRTLPLPPQKKAFGL
jgi:hypothetical protein